MNVLAIRPDLQKLLELAGWRRWLGLLAVAVSLLWFSLPAFESLLPVWQSPTYSHGYIVAVVTVFLIVVALRRGPVDVFRPSLQGLATFLFCALAMIAGLASSTVIVVQSAIPLLWISAVWAYTGKRNAFRVLLPFGYFFFAIPLWNYFVEPLTRLTVLVVSAGIRVAGLPAYIEGNFIHWPVGTFEVQGGCAGLNYVIVGTALAVLLCFLDHRRWAHRALLILAALGLALIANWLRVFTIVVVGYFSEMQHFLIAREHDDFGLLLFLLCMVPLVLLSRTLRARDQGPMTTIRTASLCKSPGTPRSSIGYALLALLAAGIWVNHRIFQNADETIATISLEGSEIPGWMRLATWDDIRRPQYVGATAQLAEWYVDGPSTVGAYVAHYANQQQEREVVFANNRPEGGAGVVVARRSIDVPVTSGATAPLEELEVSESGKRRLVWVTLRVGGKLAENSLDAKLLQLTALMRGRRDAQAMVLTANCETDCAEARMWLSEYLLATGDRLFERVAYMPPLAVEPNDELGQ